MTISEMASRLREYLEARDEWIDSIAADEEQDERFGKAIHWLGDHAAFIADELVRLSDENSRLQDEVKRLSTPDIFWDEDGIEIYADELMDCFVQAEDGEERIFDCAKRLPKITYRRVNNKDGYDIEEVTDG